MVPPAPVAPAAPAAEPASVGSGASFIDALIAEEVGEYEGEVPVAARDTSKDPLLVFSMAGFSEDQIETAQRFREAYSRMKQVNYFELLDVDRQANSADIRKAYFKLAKDYHSDRLYGMPEPVQGLGKENFALIQLAYDTLTDPEQREQYVSSVFYGKQIEEEEAAVAKVQTVLRADTIFKKGIGLLNAGQLKGAHNAFQRAMELYPQEPEYRACLGYTTFKMNYPRNRAVWEAAEQEIIEAVKANPKLDRGNYFLGRVNLAKGKPNRARRYFVRALKANPRNMDAMREYQAIKNAETEEEQGLFSSLFSRFKK